MGCAVCGLLSSLFHGFFILVEIADKVVDGFIVSKYDAGEISNNRKDDAYVALVSFFIIGFIITVLRKVVSICRIVQLCREDDCSEGKTARTIHLWTSVVKVWFEAFPQTMIIKFSFGNCATTDEMKIWVQAFNFFSLLPFIMYVLHLLSYYYHHGSEKCESDYVKPPSTEFAIITLALSAGCIVVAIPSIIAFNEICPPQLYKNETVT